MSHVGYFKKAKLREGERIIATVDGWIGNVMGKGRDTQHNGALVLTTKRVANTMAMKGGRFRSAPRRSFIERAPDGSGEPGVAAVG